MTKKLVYTIHNVFLCKKIEFLETLYFGGFKNEFSRIIDNKLYENT